MMPNPGIFGGGGAYVLPPNRGVSKAKGRFNRIAGSGPEIVKIEKIYNCVIYEKFVNEFKRMIRKYPHKQI